MFPAIMGLLGGSSAVGGAVSSFLGGGGAAGLMKSFMSGGGLFGLMSNLFGGAGGRGGADPMALMGDVRIMLSQTIDSMGQQHGGSCHGGGASRGCGQGEGPHGGGGTHGGGNHGGCEGSSKKREPENTEGSCGCDGAGSAEWDGEDKSPSLDRERAARRLLEQARNTNDPEQKRELINMALKMLGKDEHGGSCGGDGNSYDKDIVRQAEKMMETIESSDLNGCNAGKAMDSVIDMLMEEGGVDGKPAGNDHDGDDWGDHDHHRGSQGSAHGGGLWHLHDHHTMHR